ncbi:uncharacterized protein METZ01_LOCUS145481 [marine metagenome]|uniref:Uncharacterized protein n=1 Tax=marine metagenome TaxID=408172 RepID=A0A381ZUV7_9ZZZZ
MVSNYISVLKELTIIKIKSSVSQIKSIIQYLGLN